MRFGVCADSAAGAALAAAGFDFVEVNVQGALAPEKPGAEWPGRLSALRAAGVPCEAANCFLPGDLKIVGETTDRPRVERYVAAALARAEEAGIRTIVFGSGGARRVPEGFDPARAFAQLVDFGRLVGPVAARHGVRIAVEPLNKAECNILVTVGECARLCRAVGHPAVRLLVDAYHWAKDQDRYEDIVANGDLLEHVHIATYGDRLAPGKRDCDFARFFQALREARYDGRVSVEGKWDDLAAEAPAALAALRRFAAAA